MCSFCKQLIIKAPAYDYEDYCEDRKDFYADGLKEEA